MNKNKWIYSKGKFPHEASDRKKNQWMPKKKEKKEELPDTKEEFFLSKLLSVLLGGHFLSVAGGERQYSLSSKALCQVPSPASSCHYWTHLLNKQQTSNL